jgi:hypothetical protein
VADVSYYAGNSCDNLIDSLGSGCSNNRSVGIVALVTADAEEDGGQCLASETGVRCVRRSHTVFGRGSWLGCWQRP